MGTLFDQVVIHRVEFSNLTTDVLLSCSVNSTTSNYAMDVVMTSSGMNELINSLYKLEYDVDLETGLMRYVSPEGEELTIKEFESQESPVIPYYLLPSTRYLMRA